MSYPHSERNEVECVKTFDTNETALGSHRLTRQGCLEFLHGNMHALNAEKPTEASMYGSGFARYSESQSTTCWSRKKIKVIVPETRKKRNRRSA